MIETVVWDIGMVLVQWRPEAHFDSMIGEERRKALFAEADLHRMNIEIDRGLHSRDAAYAHAEKYPHWGDEIRRWHDDWIKMCSPDIPASAHLLRALKRRGVRVVSLTNFGWNTMEIAKAAYPVLNEFDQEFISGELKVIKPYPEIYEILENGTGTPPDRLLYTDDSAPNIDAAKARGWQTHLFEGPNGWGERLVAEGLLTREDLPA